MPTTRLTVETVWAKLEQLVEVCLEEFLLVKHAICALYVLGRYNEAWALLHGTLDAEDVPLTDKWSTVRNVHTFVTTPCPQTMDAVTRCGHLLAEAKRWAEAVEAFLFVGNGVEIRRLLDNLTAEVDRKEFLASYGERVLRTRANDLIWFADPNSPYLNEEREPFLQGLCADRSKRNGLGEIQSAERPKGGEELLGLAKYAMGDGKYDTAYRIYAKLKDHERLIELGDRAMETRNFGTAVQSYASALKLIEESCMPIFRL